MVVEFVCQWLRDAVFTRKSKLKGSRVVIVEMLVNKKLNLFRKVREKFKNSSWTVKGNIKVMINNKILQIDGLEQLDQLKINKTDTNVV